MKYEYDAQENCINIYFKNEKILNDFVQQNPMFGIKNTSSTDILTELLDKHIAENKEFQRYINLCLEKG